MDNNLSAIDQALDELETEMGMTMEISIVNKASEVRADGVKVNPNESLVDIVSKCQDENGENTLGINPSKEILYVNPNNGAETHDGKQTAKEFSLMDGDTLLVTNDTRVA